MTGPIRRRPVGDRSRGHDPSRSPGWGRAPLAQAPAAMAASPLGLHRDQRQPTLAGPHDDAAGAGPPSSPGASPSESPPPPGNCAHTQAPAPKRGPRPAPPEPAGGAGPPARPRTGAAPRGRSWRRRSAPLPGPRPVTGRRTTGRATAGPPQRAQSATAVSSGPMERPAAPAPARYPGPPPAP